MSCNTGGATDAAPSDVLPFLGCDETVPVATCGIDGEVAEAEAEFGRAEAVRLMGTANYERVCAWADHVVAVFGAAPPEAAEPVTDGTAGGSTVDEDGFDDDDVMDEVDRAIYEGAAADGPALLRLTAANLSELQTQLREAGKQERAGAE